MRKCLPLTVADQRFLDGAPRVRSDQELIDETEKKMCTVPAVFIEADYAALELRIAAQLAANPHLAEMMKDWGGVHPKFVDYTSTILCPRGAGKTTTNAWMMQKLREFTKGIAAPILISNSEYAPRRHVDRRPLADYTQRGAALDPIIWDSLNTLIPRPCDGLTITGRKKNDRPALNFLVTKGKT